MMPDRHNGKKDQIKIAVLALACALGLRLLLDPTLGPAHPYVFLYGALAVTALFANWQIGLAAGFAGLLASQYLFVHPRGNALPLSEPDVIGAFGFIVSAALIITTGSLFRTAENRARISSNLFKQSAARADEAVDDLREAEERMRSVVDHVLDAIITIDERGRVTTFNRAAERIFGYTGREVIGQNVKMLMPEPYKSEHDRYVENYLGTGKAKIIGVGREVVGLRKDGMTFPMELAISEFRLGKSRYFTGIVRDITDRKRLEAELNQRLQDLAQADRQKNEFLAMLGHELRNPLAPMTNALYLMRRARSDASMVEEAQSMIERQLQHLVRLVDDLLDISRIVQGKIELRLERVALADVIRRATETAQPVVDAHGHVLDVNVPQRPIYVMGDRMRLAQAVSNLLNNAAKYSTRPGTIRIQLEQAGSQATTTVGDEGEGIAPDMLPRVFDLFVQGEHTLARSGGGLGIGLTLVRRVAEMHNGSVSAYSAGRGKGSRFAITLPVLPESAPAAHAAQQPSHTVSQRASRRVLVIDDNVDAATTVARLLELAGHTVRCAHDGPTGLQLAEQFNPEVVLLDIGLPGMDGYEVARRLRASARFATVRLIALTGYGQSEDRRHSRDAGFDLHLTKPVAPELIEEAISGEQLRA